MEREGKWRFTTNLSASFQQVHRGCSFDLLAPDEKKDEEFPAEVARSNNSKGS